jgi:pyruvate-formate lyase-activating enzyme
MSDDRSVLHDHRRQWRDCLYVYPVISRRARGLSIGVNLNPDKRCNFACPYCQIDRRKRRSLDYVDLVKMGQELEIVLDAALSGRLWHERPFDAVEPALRRINDIAFSGDGEPTCVPNFDKAVEVAAAAKKAASCNEVKLVVITNATALDQPHVQRALPILDANNGEIWAKLDAGSEEYFQAVNRPCPGLSLDKIVLDIASIARGRPVVIQTLFFRMSDEGPSRRSGTARQDEGRRSGTARQNAGGPGIIAQSGGPSDAEIAAYCGRLRSIIDSGGRIKLVQLHTIARKPAEPWATALPDRELDNIANTIRKLAPDAPVETYYGGGG